MDSVAPGKFFQCDFVDTGLSTLEKKPEIDISIYSGRLVLDYPVDLARTGRAPCQNNVTGFAV